MIPKSRSGAVCRAGCAALLALTPLAVNGEEMPGADFAFDLIDPGFCMMPPPEFTDDQLRAVIGEERDEIPVTGEIDSPVAAGLYGDGFFARGAGRNAVASTIHLMVVPEEGQISGLCVALLPVNDMNVTEGHADLHAPDTAPHDGDYYMAFARLITRSDEGELIHLGELGGGEGGIVFAGDDGEIIAGELFLAGDLDSGERLQLAFEFLIFEEEALRFVDLSSR